MAKVFHANWPGWCAADCGDRIEEGDDVAYYEDELVHADCHPGPLSYGDDAPMPERKMPGRRLKPR